MKKLNLSALSFLLLLCALPGLRAAGDASSDWEKKLVIRGRGGEAEKVLQEKFDAYDGKTTLGELFQTIEKRHGLRFTADKDVDLSMEMDAYTDLGHPLGLMLHQLAQWHDLRYRWKDGAIRIGRGAYWEQALRVEGKDGALMGRLRRKVSFKMDNTPVLRVLEELDAMKKLRVVVEDRARRAGSDISGDFVDYEVGRYLWMFQNDFGYSYRWKDGVLRVDAPEPGSPEGGWMGASVAVLKALPSKSFIGEDRLAEHAFLDFPDSELEKIVKDVSESTKIPFELDPGLKGARMSIVSRSGTVRELLAILHDLHGIGYREMGSGGIALSRAYHKEGVRLLDRPEPGVADFLPRKKGPKIEGKAAKKAKSLLSKKLSLVAKATPLDRVFWSFERDTGLRFLLDPSISRAGSLTGDYDEGMLGQCLAQLAGLFQLTYRWEGEAVRVSRAPDLPAVSAAFTNKSLFDRDLSVKETGAPKHVDLLVKDEELSAVLDKVARASGREFRLDRELKDTRVTLALREAWINEVLDVLNDEFKIGHAWSGVDVIPVSRSLYSELDRCWRAERRAIEQDRRARNMKDFEAARAAKQPVPERSEEEGRLRADETYRSDLLELERRCGKNPRETPPDR